MKRLDLQDALVIMGVSSLIAGTAMIYVPAAFLLAGCLALGFAVLIQKTMKSDEDKSGPSKS